MLSADVLIIGGGPAGSAAARLLAEWERSVVVIGRAPSRRPIAESLPPSCTKLLDAVGVRGAIDRAGFIRATGNTVQWGTTERRAERFPDGAGYQVDRGEFDALLSDAAQAAGAHVVRGATARRVTRAGDLWSVDYDTESGQERCGARWLLDCSGRTGVVARAGYRRPEPSTRTTAVVGVWESGAWSDEEFATHTLVESYQDGWAWSVPVTPSRRFVTVMLDPRHSDLPSREALEAAYRGELSRTTMLRDLVHDASLVTPPWGCDASPYSASRVSDDGVLLVGDAASFVDPLSSFGVKKALASAWLAAIVVNTALSNAALGGPARELFEQRERSMYAELQRQASVLARDASRGAANDSAFWQSRSEEFDSAGGDAELDASLLRGDGRVRDAFDELKRRPVMHLRTADSLRVVDRAMVRGNQVVLDQHLASAAFPRGARYCRNVDLVTLARLAPQHDQVPDLYDAYERVAGPVPLPNFLGALSALIGLEMLVFA